MTMRKTIPERKRSSSEQSVNNNRKKTKLALIFSMVTIVAIASFAGFAVQDDSSDVSAAVVTPGANQFAADGLVYTITDTNDVTVAGWATGSDLGDLVIPEAVENNTITYTVTGIASAALQANTTLTSVKYLRRSGP